MQKVKVKLRKAVTAQCWTNVAWRRYTLYLMQLHLFQFMLPGHIFRFYRATLC